MAIMDLWVANILSTIVGKAAIDCGFDCSWGYLIVSTIQLRICELNKFIILLNALNPLEIILMYF